MLQDFSLRARMRIIMFMVCALFCIAAALALFGLHLSQQKFSQHIDQEQIARYSITKLYANGLQMGQALRNILLDPSHPQAYKNYDKAHEVFEKELNVLKKSGRKFASRRTRMARNQPLVQCTTCPTRTVNGAD